MSSGYCRSRRAAIASISRCAWLAGTPAQSYTDASPFAGHTISDAFGIWKYTNYGTFLQDKWKPNDRLTLIAGARMDYPSVPDKPLYNAAFETAFGVRHDTTNDGNYIISPRFGFNYELKTDRKTQIRGGFGLFQGKSPGVWLTNAFQTNGTPGGNTYIAHYTGYITDDLTVNAMYGRANSDHQQTVNGASGVACPSITDARVEFVNNK